MDRFVVSKKSMLTVTTKDLIQSVMYFRCTDFAKGAMGESTPKKKRAVTPSFSFVAPFGSRKAPPVCQSVFQSFCRLCAPPEAVLSETHQLR